MRIITANLNGIRSANTKGFFTWMQAQNADVVCVQETKIQAAQMTEDFLAPTGYVGHFHYAQKAGYSGVGVYTKVVPSLVKIGFDDGEFDFEGRMVQVDLTQATVVSAYFPSGSSGDERQAAKFRFLAKFLPHLHSLQAACKAAGRGLVVCSRQGQHGGSVATAALFGHGRPHVVNHHRAQHAAHVAEELAARSTLQPFAVGHAQKALVYQGGGVQAQVLT